MEDKIEVGEYVRLANGKIFKCTKVYLDKIISNHAVYKNRNIVNHSKNIIKLIKKGDYVNGKKVIAVYLDGARKYVKLDNSNGKRTYVEDIKSIVTKEQFKQIEYKVEE